MLETRGSSNMVSMVNSVCCLEYFLALSVSWISNITFLLNLPFQVNGRSTVALVREALMHLVKHGELS
jgi:hypothetical protein